jgi:predicted dehydrogenase
MSKKIRWGVIGSGGIAKRRTIPEGIVPSGNAIFAACYDINYKVNHEIAAEFGAKASGSISELLSSGIDAVYIASPASLHCGQAIACAEAGKHILCEKPLGMTVEESEKMLSACNKAKVLLGTAFMMRFHSQHQAAMKMIDEGKIGRPVFARAQLSCWYPPMEGAWRQDISKSGGGSLMDMGGHCIDLLEMFFGSIEKTMCFINRTVHGYDPEDSAVATLFFSNGAIGTVDTFFCIPDQSSKNALELYGSKGSVIASGTIGQGQAGEMTAFLSGSDSGYDACQSRGQAGGMIITPEPVNMYRAEIEEFSQAVIENRDPSNNGATGVRSQKIISACYESARTGRTVYI